MPEAPEFNYKLKISVGALMMVIVATFTLSSVYFNFQLMQQRHDTLEERDQKRYERVMEEINANKKLDWQHYREIKKSIDGQDERIDKLEYKHGN